MGLTEVEEEEAGAVAHAVVSADDEQVRAHLRGRVPEAVVDLVGLDLVPDLGVCGERVSSTHAAPVDSTHQAAGCECR